MQVLHLHPGFQLTQEVDGAPTSWVCQAHAQGPGRRQLRAQLGERQVQATVVAQGGRRTVFFDGRSHCLTLVDPLASEGVADEALGGLCAPMPGRVIAWRVQPGARVEKGQPLLVLEAMKMEHTLLAPQAGCVTSFHYQPGDTVSDGAVLVDMTSES
jgi:3-methylcrotonyl-CoA carboxylase alpha subunit